MRQQLAARGHVLRGVMGLFETRGHLTRAGDLPTADGFALVATALTVPTPVNPLGAATVEIGVGKGISCAMLRKMGIDPTVVADGAEAVAAMAQTHVDVVLMPRSVPLEASGAGRPQAQCIEEVA